MSKYWLLHDEFYRTLHRWPTMIGFSALGCLLGWLCSFIWPPYYRATSQLYVGLNPYRTYSDTNFLALAKPRYSNIDNYHYWQMHQLEAVIFLDDFIQDTLDDLRKIDPYWETIDNSQLMDMLDVEWRTAGLWSLIAEHPDPELSTTAAQTWSRVVVKRVEVAVQSARNSFIIDQQLQVVTAELLESQFRQRDLLHAKSSLLEWSAAVQNLPKDQPLNLNERWHILYLVNHLAQFTPTWQAILQEQPLESSNPEIYKDWISKVIPQIDGELSGLSQQIVDLEQEYEQLEENYSPEADKSLGLSPNLEVKDIKDLPSIIIRPTGTFILIGGIIGLLIWVLTQLVIITNRAKDQ